MTAIHFQKCGLVANKVRVRIDTRRQVDAKFLLQIDLIPVSNDFFTHSVQPFTRKAPFRTVTRCSRVECAPLYEPRSRRDLLQLVLLSASLVATPGSALAEKIPKGFVAVRDQQDAYSFLYPFGWQEVSIDGQDVVFKDVIEPLESVSVNLVPTEKKDVTEYGDVKEVAFTLADKVLTNPNQETVLLDAQERKVNDRAYYDFEFLAKSRGFTRHAVASVTVANGKFYTLVTGSNEKRWGKMSNKIKTVVKSFEVGERY